MFVDDPVIGGICYDAQGVISVPETVGLGATVNEEYLKGLKKSIIN
jgi:hypothetical protein